MTVPQPEQVLVAGGDDVEPLLRTTRAEIARLSLQARALEHEAEQLEAALATDDVREAELLRASLDELVQSRRHELEQELEQEVVRAAALVAEAQQQAAVAPLHATAERESPASGGWSRPPAEPEPSPSGDGEPGDHDRDDPAERLDEQSGEQRHHDPAARHAEDPGDQRGKDRSEPHAEDTGEQPDAAVDPSVVRELVSAAVSAAVAELVRAGTVVGAHRAAAPWPDEPWPSGQTRARPALAPERPRPPWWRQLLHVDVFLPLLLVVIVIVVLMAWAG